MYGFIILCVIIVIFLSSIYCQSNMIGNSPITKKYGEFSDRLNSGDLLMLVSGDSIQKMYFIYRKGGSLKVVDIDSKGKIVLKNLSGILNNTKLMPYVFKLKIPLTNLQLSSLKRLLGRNYAGMGDANCILNYSRKQYAYNCDTFIVNIMSRIGMLGTGLQAECLNHSDPRCLQQFYDTSVYINGGLFEINPYVLKYH